jgi:hypothetical protein
MEALFQAMVVATFAHPKICMWQRRNWQKQSRWQQRMIRQRKKIKPLQRKFFDNAPSRSDRYDPISWLFPVEEYRQLLEDIALDLLVWSWIEVSFSVVKFINIDRKIMWKKSHEFSNQGTLSNFGLSPFVFCSSVFIKLLLLLVFSQKRSCTTWRPWGM